MENKILVIKTPHIRVKNSTYNIYIYAQFKLTEIFIHWNHPDNHNVK